ncbi:neprilysin-1-like [Amblyomma americanum]
MWKPQGSEDSPARNGILTTLLLCQVFRPCLRRGFILLLLSAAGLFVSVTYSKGLVAWSSIFVANPMVPKVFPGDESWRLGPGSNPSVNLHGNSSKSHASKVDRQRHNRSLHNLEKASLGTSSVPSISHSVSQVNQTSSQQKAVTSQRLHEFDRIDEVVAGTETTTPEVQEILPAGSVLPRVDVEGGAETASESAPAGETPPAEDASGRADQSPIAESPIPTEAAADATPPMADESSPTEESTKADDSMSSVSDEATIGETTQAADESSPTGESTVGDDTMSPSPSELPTSSESEESTAESSSQETMSESSGSEPSNGGGITTGPGEIVETEMSPGSETASSTAESAAETAESSSDESSESTSSATDTSSEGMSTESGEAPDSSSSISEESTAETSQGSVELTESNPTSISEETTGEVSEGSTESTESNPTLMSDETTMETTGGSMESTESNPTLMSDETTMETTGGSMESTESNPTLMSDETTMETTGESMQSTESNTTQIPDGMTTTTEKRGPRPPKSANGSYICDTPFCKAEATALSGIFASSLDPCDNFYKYVCTDWKAMSNDSQQYNSADDALSGSMEEMARMMLDVKSPTEEMPLYNLWNACNENGTEDEDKLNETLASFGISLENKDKATIEDVLKAAGNLLYKLNTAPLLSIELAMVPNSEKAKMLAIGEADTILSVVAASDPTSMKALQNLTCKFEKAVGIVAEETSQLCVNLAQFAIALAQASYEKKSIYDIMDKYTMVDYSNVSMFGPLLDMIDGVKNYTEAGAAVLVKNTDQLEVVKSHFSSPTMLYAYLAFHTTIYLSPFFENKDYLWDVSMFTLTGRNHPTPVPKWRLCLRLVDRVLPGFMIVALEKNDTTTPEFVELMADVMAEEVRSSFIDEVMALQHLDNWTRYVLTKKAQSVVVHSLFPARFAASVIVKSLILKINTEIHWSKNSLQHFLQISAFMAKDWTGSLRHPLVDRRRGLSVFDTDCHFNPQKNAVVLPLAFYNISVPTSARERMFHIPRIGPRITQCLFRATFTTNFFMPYDFFWTEYSSAKVSEIASCFNAQYKNGSKDTSKLPKIEANTGVVVAFETFQDRLFSKHYLEVDYTLHGLPNATADQIFFVTYAQSLCHRADVDTTKMMMTPEERVNVPLMNSVEFSTAFHCRAGSPMNPAKKCNFWD